MTKRIQVEIIPQLKDNYSYLVCSNVNKLGVIIDPADAAPIIKFIKDKDIILSGILITHHHTDHNSGINDLIKFQSTKIYSPDKNINKKSNIVIEKSMGLTSKGKRFDLDKKALGANLITIEAIFLLSYQKFEPIKIHSKQKSFYNTSAIVR